MRLTLRALKFLQVIKLNRQMNLVLALEDEFGIEIPDLEIQNMISVNLIVLLVQELLDQ